MTEEIIKQELKDILGSKFTIPVGSDYQPEVLETLRNFQVRNSDIYLMGHPKTGTTWAQEMIWLIANDMNVKEAEKFIDERFPVLELVTILFAFPIAEGNPEIEKPLYHSDSIKVLENRKDPRFIKTHLRWSYLPKEIQEGSKKPKIIYICRNVKDTCVSLYHYWKNILEIYSGTMEEFCKVFLAGRVGAGLYWDHVLSFWNKSKMENNILFIKYEDMKDNLPEVVQRVALFLNKSITTEQLTILVARLDFDFMKNNRAVNHNELYKKSGFMRNGKVGGYKEDMPAHMIKKFDNWTSECLKDTGLENCYCCDS